MVPINLNQTDRLELFKKEPPRENVCEEKSIRDGLPVAQTSAPKESLVEGLQWFGFATDASRWYLLAEINKMFISVV